MQNRKCLETIKSKMNKSSGENIKMLADILERIKNNYANKNYNTERDKGTAFERLMIKFFQTDLLYNQKYKNIWMWGDWAELFPEYNFSAKDTGIDLVAQDNNSEFYAIQCKFYSEEHILKKEDIDSFFTLSGKKPFTERIIIVTTNNVSDNVNTSLDNQTIPVNLITLDDLENSSIDWLQLDLNNIESLPKKPKKTIRPHQQEALENAIDYYKINNKGKLIMACGTGKTYASLKIMESITPDNANILFLVPSLSLLSQTLKEWNYEAESPIISYAVCSDSKIGKDSEDMKVHELSYPATTDADKLVKSFNDTKSNDQRTVIFSTYQSLDIIQKAQEKNLPEFDLIICDEAHKTTGIINNKIALNKTGEIKDDSNFVLVHDNNKIKTKKRMYMTATPRIYSPNVTKIAQRREIELCSMDNPEIYGDTIYQLSFSKAVEEGLLSDYQVLVLMVGSHYINENMQSELANNSELDLGDVAKIVGCYNGLSKKINETEIYFDKNPMKRAVAFAGSIKYSKNMSNEFKNITVNLGDLKCESKHIDGTQNVLERNKGLDWLRDAIPDNECRILSNARCLSEGIDVPALDAVMFLNPRDSEIDIVQSVGRVMRKSEGKKYGYIILPVFIPVAENPEQALKDNKKYEIIWKTLESLRAHDEKMDKEINQLKYNGQSDRIHIIGTGVSISKEQPGFDFPEDEIKLWKDAIRVKIVEKCGDKEYLRNWTKDIIDIMNIHIERINFILKNNETDRQEFDKFLAELRSNVSPVISEEDAIIMLSQHLITKPVFDTLFSSEFAKYNPVSMAMDKMIAVLDEKGLENETKKLEKFYDAVKNKVSAVKNFNDKQKIIIELYDNFFSQANPKLSDKLGIVYTPIEIVDFIVNSVEHVLQMEFNTKLENENVHILDPFTGTGTFITRLLQNGIISADKLENKYKYELHANEIMLLAYYIAAINIEETYHNINTGKEYAPFKGIVLTDTFRLLEDEYKEQQEQYHGSTIMDEDRLYPLKRNSKRALKQKRQDIRVIIGNPPYSVKQGSENDNNKSEKYPALDKKINETYAKNSTAQLKQSLHDSYIRAFRWATDRIKDKGVICFISNGSYVNGKALDGFRKSLFDDFTSVYCFNLKGNFRKFDKNEGENVFGNSCGTTVAVTLLIKNPAKEKNNKVFYYEIPNALRTQEKLAYIANLKDIGNIEWQEIIPNESQDWIKQRNPVFSDFISMGDKQNKNKKTIFSIYSNGIKTQRDSWCYNFSKEKLEHNIKSMIDFYNTEVNRYSNVGNPPENMDSFVNNDTTKISWTRGLKKRLKNNGKLEFNAGSITQATYRPFCNQWLYYNGTRELNEEISQIPQIFPDKNLNNIMIYTSGLGDKGFSSVVINSIPDLNMQHSGGQGFPLYYYEKNNQLKEVSLLEPIEQQQENSNGNEYTRRDNISDEFLKEIQDKYNDANITKEDIFYYIYGILNSPDYKTKFANDLTKMLPSIPFVNEFKEISRLGKQLADLHVNYETIEPYPLIETILNNAKYLPEDKLYRVDKIKFGRKDKNKDKSVIIYNDYITLSGIPLEAYDYIVNGKSAIEWVIDRYQVSTYKDSGLKNDPNDYLEEIQDYKYIVNLLKKITNVSIKSVGMISELSKYSILEDEINASIDSKNIIYLNNIKSNKENINDIDFKYDIIPDNAVDENQKYVEYLPVYSLEAAASGFSGEEHVEKLGWKKAGLNSSSDIPDNSRYSDHYNNNNNGNNNDNYNDNGAIVIAIPNKAQPNFKLSKDMFIAKVVGKSMEPTIPDGSYCVFRFERGGSRNGKIVLVESKRFVADPAINQKFTVKRYRSEKVNINQSLDDRSALAPDGTREVPSGLSRLRGNDNEYAEEGGEQWKHKRIILSPDNKDFNDIILENVSEDDFKVVAEFISVA
ncbi:MAG: type ISP restriction/modification enzyme [bacterium]